MKDRLHWQYEMRILRCLMRNLDPAKFATGLPVEPVPVSEPAHFMRHHPPVVMSLAEGAERHERAQRLRRPPAPDQLIGHDLPEFEEAPAGVWMAGQVVMPPR